MFIHQTKIFQILLFVYMDGIDMTESLEIVGQNIDCLTGEITPLYRTAEYDAMQAQDAAEAAARAAEAATKAIAKAELLTQLGITEEQARLLLS
jgi:hypothetical protein